MAEIDITLANMALQKIGATDTVSDPAQESEAARSIRNAWGEVRRATIRGTPKVKPKWNFARRYFELAARAADPAWPVPHGWSALYPLPAESLRFLEIATPHSARDRFDLIMGPAGEELAVCTAGVLGIWCLVDVTDPARWDAIFRNAFAARLGFQIADRITGDRGRKQDCWAEFMAEITGAAGADGAEGAPIEPQESDWVLARYGCFGSDDWGRPV
ncbi:hypothetical protein HZY97_16240 [Sphingomonas sp. R-74633]|uniref:hypothetical protein n=1 Tax=Sphingomonas sp. R-74633 TaxID=2751188 RepID=UPI0015D30654|nr:hypothetical protein [Sphingomonas sp. R-74633]NYT42323.1 hypothetical protein [Sphingomonas sp. R-74633]